MLSYHDNLIKWLDALSEAFFIKTQFVQKKADPEITAIIAKI